MTEQEYVRPCGCELEFKCLCINPMFMLENCDSYEHNKVYDVILPSGNKIQLVCYHRDHKKGLYFIVTDDKVTKEVHDEIKKIDFNDIQIVK